MRRWTVRRIATRGASRSVPAPAQTTTVPHASGPSGVSTRPGATAVASARRMRPPSSRRSQSTAAAARIAPPRGSHSSGPASAASAGWASPACRRTVAATPAARSRAASPATSPPSRSAPSGPTSGSPARSDQASHALARPHGIGDLRGRRVEVAEAARDARGLARARRAALEHDDLGAAADERVRRRQPDDPAAHDDRSGVRHAAHASRRRRPARPRPAGASATPRRPPPARARRPRSRRPRTSDAARAA